jgi:Flp pilus assembly protein TadB
MAAVAANWIEGIDMKAVGFLMLLAGWFLVLTAIVLLKSTPLRAMFILVGVAVEALGLTLAFRSHLIPREEKR